MSNVVASRCWWLPTAEGAGWLVPEEHDPGELARVLSAGRSVVLAVEPLAEENASAFDAAVGRVLRVITRTAYDSYFRAASRVLVAGAWVFSSLALCRLPSDLRIIGWVLLIPGLLFTLYVLVKCVYPAVQWASRQAAAGRALGEAHWESNALLARLQGALQFRKGLSMEQRGRQPDAELLDADAYRKLVDEGVTTTEELRRLGRSLEGLLGPSNGGSSPKVVDLAERNGIDMNTVLFYLDLVSAARRL